MYKTKEEKLDDFVINIRFVNTNCIYGRDINNRYYKIYRNKISEEFKVGETYYFKGVRMDSKITFAIEPLLLKNIEELVIPI